MTIQTVAVDDRRVDFRRVVDTRVDEPIPDRRTHDDERC
jgi:hypothetical protein